MALGVGPLLADGLPGCPFLRGWDAADVKHTLAQTAAALKQAGAECQKIQSKTNEVTAKIQIIQERAAAGSEPELTSASLKEVQSALKQLNEQLDGCRRETQDNVTRSTVSLMSAMAAVDPAGGAATYGVALGGQLLKKAADYVGGKLNPSFQDRRAVDELHCLFLMAEYQAFGCPLRSARAKESHLPMGILENWQRHLFYGVPKHRGLGELHGWMAKAKGGVNPTELLRDLEILLESPVALMDGPMPMKAFVGQRAREMQEARSGLKADLDQLRTNGMKMTDFLASYERYLASPPQTSHEAALELLRRTQNFDFGSVLDFTFGPVKEEFKKISAKEKAQKEVRELESAAPEKQAHLDVALSSLTQQLQKTTKKTLGDAWNRFPHHGSRNQNARDRVGEYGSTVKPLFDLCGLLAAVFHLDTTSKAFPQAMLKKVPMGLRNEYASKCSVFSCVIPNFSEFKPAQFNEFQCEMISQYDQAETSVREAFIAHGTPCPTPGAPNAPTSLAPRSTSH